MMIGQASRTASSSFRAAGVRTASSTAGSCTDQSATGKGLRVVSETSEGALATVCVTVGAGSSAETHAKNGGANLLQRLAFKGTAGRPGAALNDEIRALGGGFSATTTHDSTVFTATVAKKNVGQAVDILADMVQNASLEEAAVEAEKAAVLAELGPSPATNDIMEHLHDTSFLGTALGMPVAGTPASVAGLTAGDLTAFRSARYAADSLILTATGAVDHAELVQAAESKFSGLGAKSEALPTFDSSAFTGSDVLYREDDFPTASVGWAFETGGMNSPHYVATLLMAEVLGSWDAVSDLGGRNVASKLGQVSSENKLTQSFSSFVVPYANTGLFGVRAVAQDNKLFETSGWVLEHMVRLAHDVSEGELIRAKTSLKRQLLARADNRQTSAQDIATEVRLLDGRVGAANWISLVDAVSLDDLKAAAMHIVHDQDVSVAAVGPIHELPDYNWMRRRTYWLRY